MIRLAKIERERRLDCPGCGRTRLVATRDSANVPGGGCWLSDGDTIFGLYQDLVDSGMEKAVEVDEPKAWDSVNYDYEMLVGECPSCGEQYFVLQVSMIDDAVEVDREFVESYFRANAPAPEPTNFVARLAESSLEWLVQRHDTSKGIALTHVFGPFGLDGKTLNGSKGVEDWGSGDFDAWRAGRSFVFGMWPHLKTLARLVSQGVGPADVGTQIGPTRKRKLLD